MAEMPHWSLQTNSINISQIMSTPILLTKPFNVPRGESILFPPKQTSHFIVLLKPKVPECFPKYHILFWLPATALKLPIVHFIHSAMIKGWGWGCKELHRELSPGVKIDIKVWMSFVQFLLTLLENSFYQSPSQTQTEDCSLRDQSKEVLPWTTVPAITDLPQG